MGRPKKKVEELKIRFSARLHRELIDIIKSAHEKDNTEKIEKIIEFYGQNRSRNLSGANTGRMGGEGSNN